MVFVTMVLMYFVQEAAVRLTSYHVPQGAGDIVMIQSDHTGAVDILSAELETADLLGEQRKGESWKENTCWGYFLSASPG